MLWARRQAKITAPLAIAGPPGTAGLVERVRAVYAEGYLDTACEVTGYPFRLAGLEAVAFPARHSPEAVCLRLSADGRVLAYSGDTADCEGLRAAVRGADLALLEATSNDAMDGHLTPADCEAVVAAERPRNVLLTHLGPEVASSLPRARDGLRVTA